MWSIRVDGLINFYPTLSESDGCPDGLFESGDGCPAWVSRVR